VAMIRKRVGKKKGTDGKVRKTTTWQAVVRRSDHPTQTKTFKTKRESEVWATSIEDAMNTYIRIQYDVANDLGHRYSDYLLLPHHGQPFAAQ